jgi:[acyl-carrier-protein] S-malonyltransferase
MALPAAIVFPGQGSQHLNMLSQGGLLNIAKSSEYAPLIDICSDLIQVDYLDLLENGPEDDLNKTSITQPALLLTSYFHYLRLIADTNVEPALFAGHSLGEYTALVAAESLGIEEALALVRQRGLLMEQAPKGSMAAILGLDLPVIQEICDEISRDGSFNVQCANLNSPSQTVISGSLKAIDKAQNICIERGAKRAIKLNVSIASHSSLMRAAAESFNLYLSASSFDVPKIKVIHNVGCTITSSTHEIIDLLTKQLYSPVEWVKACDLIKESNCIAIECGPGKVLSGLMKANGIKTYFSTSDPQFYEKIKNNAK